MDWLKFLELARCPSPLDELSCQGKLEQIHSRLVCRQCFFSYELNVKFGFPLLTFRSSEEAKADRYEDSRYRHAEHYAGLWAFGYYFLRRGEAEGFYRTINELIFTTSLKNEEQLRILEIGCGVGRTVCDVARHYPNAFVIGIDLSQRMLEQAYQMVIGSPPGGRVEVSLENEGFGVVSAKSFGLTNVFLSQANALSLPFAAAQFDLVICANLIDRVPDPGEIFQEVERVLKPGGYFAFADPFNWSKQPDWWHKCSTLDQFEELLGQYALEVDQAFDGLVYREVVDIRGAYNDWPVAIVRAKKTYKHG
jgi:ubiquinone/menaquinone biosynthesis C-methylase UbiE